jgi:hypothetical protein
LPYKPGREQTHVPGQTHQIDLLGLECADYLALLLLAVTSFGGYNQGIQAALAGNVDSGSLRPVRDHQRDPRPWNAAGVNSIGDSYKV